MHESVSVHNVGQCTRPWFEWANAMLVVLVENALGLDCGEPPDPAEPDAAVNPQVPACFTSSYAYVCCWLSRG